MGTPVSDDANGGGSDTEDGCALETCSVICSDKMGSKVDEDLRLPVMDTKDEDSNAVEKILTTEVDEYENNNAAGPPNQNNFDVEKAFVSDACQMECKSELAYFWNLFLFRALNVCICFW